MKTRFIPLIYILIMVFLTIGTSFAQHRDVGLLRTAYQLWQEGRAETAYAMLKPVERLYFDDVDYYSLVAQIALALDKKDEAIQAFEKITLLKPDNVQVKMNLAALLMQEGDVEEAEKIINELEEEGLTDEQKRSFKEFQSYMELVNQGGHRFNGFVSFGYEDNDNANYGPDQSLDQIITTVGILNLDDESKEIKDTSRISGFGVGHEYHNLDDGWAWVSQFQYQYKDLQSLDDLDLRTISLSSGPALKLSDKVRFRMPMQFYHIRLGHETSYYAYVYGITPTLHVILDENHRMHASTAFNQTKFRDSKRNTDDVKANIDYIYKMPFEASLSGIKIENGVFSSNGFIGRSVADEGVYSYDIYGLSGRLAYDIGERINLSLGANYRVTSYDANDKVFGKRKRNESRSYNLGISYKLSTKETGFFANSSLRASLTKSDNNSTIETSEYEQNLFSLSFTKSI